MKDLAALQIRLGATFVYATENLREALTVGTKVAILREGKLLQCDTPVNLFAHPADEYVAELMGSVCQQTGTAETEESQTAEEPSAEAEV